MKRKLITGEIDFNYYEEIYKEDTTESILDKIKHLENNHIFEWENMLIMFQEVLHRRNVDVEVKFEYKYTPEKIEGSIDNRNEEEVRNYFDKEYDNLSKESDRLEEEEEQKQYDRDINIYLKDL